MNHYSLEELLNGMERDDFAELTKTYQVVWNIDSPHRKRAISTLKKRILDMEGLYYQAMGMNQDNWNRFCRADKTPIPADEDGNPDGDYDIADKMGYLFKVELDGKSVFVLPSEVSELIRRPEWRDYYNGVLLRRRLLLCANSAVNLYGVLEFTDFLGIYDKYCAPTLPEELAWDALLMFEDMRLSDYFVSDEMLISFDFEGDDDEARKLIARAALRPRYYPPQKQFFLYFDPTYFDLTPAAEKLRDFIRSTMLADNDYEGDAETNANYLLYELNGICREDTLTVGMEEAVDALEEFGVIFTDHASVQTFVALFTDLQNNTRQWVLNGHTPIELSPNGKKSNKLSVHTPAKAAAKPGRNAPCPCGSGKKYKNCCGKNDNIIQFPGRKVT